MRAVGPTDEVYPEKLEAAEGDGLGPGQPWEELHFESHGLEERD
jgi:hypothetical protein